MSIDRNKNIENTFRATLISRKYRLQGKFIFSDGWMDGWMDGCDVTVSVSSFDVFKAAALAETKISVPPLWLLRIRATLTHKY